MGEGICFTSSSTPQTPPMDPAVTHAGTVAQYTRLALMVLTAAHWVIISGRSNKEGCRWVRFLMWCD